MAAPATMFILVPPTLLPKETKALGKQVYLFFFPLFLVQVGSCRHNRERIHWVDSTQVVSGQFRLANALATPTPFTINLINQKGERSPIGEAIVQEETSHFTFLLDNQEITGNIKDYASNQLATMGAKSFEIKQSNGLGQKTAGLARIEVLPKTLNKTASQFPYQQFVIPISVQETLQTGIGIPISTDIVLQNVGQAWAKVTDINGQPIKNASVMALVEGSFTKQEHSIPAWQVPLYQPIITHTNAQGEASLTPLSISGKDPQYRIIAFAKDHCVYVSPRIIYESVKKSSPTPIILNTCQRDDSILDNVVSFQGPTFIEDISRDLSAGVRYTNQRLIKIRIDSNSLKMQGLRIQIIEGWENESSSEEATIFEVDRFQSEFEVKLPIIFSLSGTENGKFKIKIQPKITDQKNTNNTASRYLYGRKNVDRPNLLFTDSLKILSSIGEPGVISGRTEGTFSVQSDLCSNGSYMGISVFNQEAIYRSCENNQAFFTNNDLLLPGKTDQIGGLVDIKVFFKNRYGNINFDDILGTNTLSVHVDYGIPDLSINPPSMQVRFGIIGKDQVELAQATNDDPISFSDGITNTTTITPGNISDYVLSFSSPDSCLYQNPGSNSFEGIQDGLLGLKISRYLVEATAKKATLSQNFIPCSLGEPGKAIEFSLTTDHINFPSDPSQSSWLFLKVMDAAGHTSLPQGYEILSCPEDDQKTEGIAICWRP